MNPSKEIDFLTDELEVHCIQPEENLNQNNEITLIAKILTQKITNLNAFKAAILRAWNPSGKVLTNTLHTNTMAFIFDKEDDIHKVLNSTWTYRDQHIVIARWPPDKSLPEITLDKILFWVHIFGIPVCYANLNTAQAIGGMLGTFVKSDINSNTQRWKKSIRVQVEIDINKPLISSMVLYCNSRNRFLTEIRYERSADNVFGPWMKVENTQIMNPKFQRISEFPDQRNPNLVAIPPSLSSSKTDPKPSTGNLLSDQEMIGEGTTSAVKIDTKVTGEDTTPAGKIDTKVKVPVTINKLDKQDEKQKDVGKLPLMDCSPSSAIDISDKSAHQIEPATVDSISIGPGKSALSATEDLGHMGYTVETSTDIVKVIGPQEQSGEWAAEKSMGLSLKRKFDNSPLPDPDPLQSSPLNPGNMTDRNLTFFPQPQSKKPKIGKSSKGEILVSDLPLRPITYSIARKEDVRALRLILKESRADVVLISEIKSSFSPQISAALNSFKLCNFSFSPPSGTSGGLILAWKTDIDLTISDINQHYFHTIINFDRDLQPLYFTAVYAPATFTKRMAFWEEIQAISIPDSNPWLLMGDLNSILHHSEKLGGNPFVSSSPKNLAIHLNALGLVDLGFSGSPFTWNNKRSGAANIQQRLDRAVGNDVWLEYF
ncbi:hypothetical protein CASFOL_018936 [Castilleja foliolosa]|uniref:DUF4283 domain-containing protein n=1 Tax=Castilleja foliolosa TaxID=1961234 RepID=A0ABD3D4J6_9LAMI